MKFQNRNKRQNGFTLVELAIVITIIGILIGGVLKGQQLIEQARIAGTVAELRNYQVAFQIFKTKYNEIPGDMRDPDARIVGCDGCKAEEEDPQGNGDINGVDIYGYADDKGNETTRVWLHLMKAGMISGVSDAAVTSEPIGVGATHPATKIGGGYFIETGRDDGCEAGHSTFSLWNDEGCEPVGHVLFIHGGINEQDALLRNFRIMSPASAAQIDRKIDDGKPHSGDVRGIAKISGMRGCSNADGNYAEAETKDKACSSAYIIDR